MGDGTFDPDSPSALPNEFCRETHFPGFPDSADSALLVGLMFGAPVVVLVAAGLLAFAARRPRIARIGFYLALALTAAVTVAGLILGDIAVRGVP